jgi:hypothetical protein
MKTDPRSDFALWQAARNAVRNIESGENTEANHTLLNEVTAEQIRRSS